MRSWLFLAVVLLVVLVACASGEGSSGDTSSSPSREADVALGEELYQANCARCHGVDLQGTDEGPPHLDSVYLPNHHSDAAFLLAVRNGVQPHHWSFGAMPAIEGLDDQDVADIIAYVRDRQRAAGLIQ